MSPLRVTGLLRGAIGSGTRAGKRMTTAELSRHGSAARCWGDKQKRVRHDLFSPTIFTPHSGSFSPTTDTASLSLWTARASWHSSRCRPRRFKSLRIFCNHARLFFGSRIAEVRSYFPCVGSVYFHHSKRPLPTAACCCCSSMRTVFILHGALARALQRNLISAEGRRSFAWPVDAPE